VDVQLGKSGAFIKYLKFEKRYSGHTIISYQNDLDQFEGFLQSNYPDFTLATSEYSVIRSWIIELSERGLDASSINRKIACLRSYYKFLLREEIISQSPMMKIKVLKTNKKLPHFVKEGDMTSMLDGSFENNHDGLRQRLILELFYGTGMRLSELISLKESQINLHDQTLKVLGKRNKERVIPFSTSLVSMIKEYKAARDKEVALKEGYPFLFVTDRGEQLYPMMVQRIVKKYLKVFSSVEKKSPHVLRHSYATHLLNKGAEINAVKDLLGHSSLSATQVYTHNTFEKLKKTFDQAHPKA
jgi:integrase/recombinase XerC